MKSVVDNVARVLDQPSLLLKKALSVCPGLSIETRSRYDALPRPQYAYGLLQAAGQAKLLGINRITALELGVGDGRGLRVLESHATQVAEMTSIRIDVVGFDTGDGMPPPEDVRDLPYRWTEHEFWMNPEKVRDSLTHAQLILGNVADTIPEFMNNESNAPIGFVAFDLDYYSSTRDAMPLLTADVMRYLPRVHCYIDDIVGDDWELHCDRVGELAAIHDFNTSNTNRFLGPIHGLRHKRVTPAAWNDQMYALHVFDHPWYNHLLPQWNIWHQSGDSKMNQLRQEQAAIRQRQTKP